MVTREPLVDLTRNDPSAKPSLGCQFSRLSLVWQKIQEPLTLDNYALHCTRVNIVENTWHHKCVWLQAVPLGLDLAPIGHTRELSQVSLQSNKTLLWSQSAPAGELSFWRVTKISGRTAYHWIWSFPFDVVCSAISSFTNPVEMAASWTFKQLYRRLLKLWGALIHFYLFREITV